MSKWYSIDNLSDGSLLVEFARQAVKYSNYVHIPSPVEWTFMYTSWILSLFSCLYRKRLFRMVNCFILAWLFWMLICDIRGIFSVDIYWDMKNMMNNVPILLLPMFAVLFAIPERTLTFLRRWNWLFIGQLVLIIIGFIGIGNIHFLLGAAYFLYGSFFILIPNKKWKYLIILLFLLMISSQDDRSQVIKALFSIFICICLWLYRPMMRYFLRVGGMILYPLALVFLYLGISGQWNFFDHSDHSKDGLVSYVNGRVDESMESSLSSDTRTFLYVDIVTSAIENDYVLFGRTPARGNDGTAFYAHMGTKNLEEDMRYERNKNEFCHPDIFTWTGLLGVILYSLIYFHASILALFYSKNKYIMFLGVVTSFNWFFGWIENCNVYDMMNITIWMIIGMCLSPEFRKMSNAEFVIWFQSLFSDNKVTKYHKLVFVRNYLKYRRVLRNSNKEEMDTNSI